MKADESAVWGNHEAVPETPGLQIRTTYPKNEANREAAKLVPADRLLVETDCPFLSPQPKRGKRNEPSYVRHVVEILSNVRGESFDQVAEQTSANAARLFGLPATGS